MASFLPAKDAALLAWAVNFKTLIGGKGTEYGLTPAQAVQFGALTDVFSAKYQVAVEPGTRTRVTVAEKDAARNAVKADARNLAKIVEGTPAVTDAQKRALGLNVRKQPSPNPAPTDRPALTIVSVAGRTVTVKIRDNGESSRRGKPAGALGASVYSYVGNTYPTDPTLWQFDGTTTKTTHAIVFPDTVPNGAQIWVCAAWFNRKTETGPVSIPVTTNIQGGLALGNSVQLKIAA